MKNRFALTTALLLAHLLVGCGKSSKSTVPAPAPTSSSAPQSRSEAQPLAQQTAEVATSFITQAKNLIGVATVPGSKPARMRPMRGFDAASDSVSWTYSYRYFNAAGDSIDYATQADQLASVAFDWTLYAHVSTDSTLSEIDYRTHSRIDGFEAAATRFVANATDTSHYAYDGTTSGYHSLGSFDGRANIVNVAWEKSGNPTYPVAGSITVHWHYLYDTTYQGKHYTGTYEIDGTITFNGTRTATVVVGAYTYSVDLVTGVVS